MNTGVFRAEPAASAISWFRNPSSAFVWSRLFPNVASVMPLEMTLAETLIAVGHARVLRED
jgi:hypothetical protein